MIPEVIAITPNCELARQVVALKPLLFPLAHVNKQLRDEFLTYFFAHMRIALRWLNVELFIRDMLLRCMQ